MGGSLLMQGQPPNGSAAWMETGRNSRARFELPSGLCEKMAQHFDLRTGVTCVAARQHPRASRSGWTTPACNQNVSSFNSKMTPQTPHIYVCARIPLRGSLG